MCAKHYAAKYASFFKLQLSTSFAQRNIPVKYAKFCDNISDQDNCQTSVQNAIRAKTAKPLTTC